MWESGGIAPRTVSLETDGGDWRTSSPSRFTMGKEQKLQFQRKLSGLQSRCLRFGGVKISTL
jgi:hypothetical protein